MKENKEEELKQQGNNTQQPETATSDNTDKMAEKEQQQNPEVKADQPQEAGQPEEIEYEYGKHDRRRKAVFHPLAKAKPQKQRHGPEGRGPAKVQQTGPLPVFGGIFGAPPGAAQFSLV